jgi:DNA-binding MarR family transcriptional regulator
MQILQVQSPEVLRSKIHGYFRTSEEARFVHRLHGILLKIDQRESACAEIARLFGQSPRTVSNWINKVNKAGDIEVLRDAKKAGRKPRLGAAQLAQVREVLQKGPGESQGCCILNNG